ncbi:hypothetical protein [Streptomyces malaysiensis]|uniref:hypothetical protein n=1 Tax=Streptomyces malaysiensis TaxID=92644 RepID=UPI0020763FD3|nr:hypothetical protein [Streptomyces malaysiensis]
MADALASHGTTVVLDTLPRLSSPWSGWTTSPGAGLASIPPDQPVYAGHVRAAAGSGPASGTWSWQVMTDHRRWDTAPLPLPDAPEAWYQLAAIGGWQAVVVDTGHHAAHDIVSSRHAGQAGISARWCSLPYAVPVLCAPATSDGVAALQTAVMAAEADGMPLQRTIVALVGVGEGRWPAPVKAAATMLDPKVGALIQVPYDPWIRAHGLRDAARLKPRTRTAGRDLVRAALSLAHTTWGEPLPPAAVPAPLLEGTPSRGRPAQSAAVAAIPR